MDSGAQSPRPAGETGTPDGPATDVGAPGKPTADTGAPDKPTEDGGTSDRPTGDGGTPDRPAPDTGAPGRPTEDSGTPGRPTGEGGTPGIGRRIRGLREERGISLSALARAAGVGKATLSGLENGTRNPTLETLWAITAELGVPLAMAVGTPPPVDAGGGGRTGGIPVVPGTAVEGTLLQVFEDEGVTYELYRLVIRAGTTQVSPAHHEGVTEHVTVFAGTLGAGPAGAPLRAGPGEHISWRSDVPHSYAALGDLDVHASLLIRYPRR
ncbi:helix-turn-helix domain-containing protein [Streptosporangium sp. NPDC002524]|uniref:helix-turn-helix domain-containing protein n=1 Tax=Streptosporangium sp. NPDC002524 TaxID=3154537 RepID=UPI0033337E39